jgi:hypothetical protein
MHCSCYSNTGGYSYIHTLLPQSVVHQVVMLLHRIHTLLSLSVVRQVAMLLHHIRTLHLLDIHTLHLNLFTLEMVTTRVEEKTPPIPLKLRQE